LKYSVPRLIYLLVILLAALTIACDKDDPSSAPTATAAGAASSPSPQPTAEAPSATATPAPAPTLPPPPPIEWSDCDGWQCAEFTVPLDYANPAASELTLALTRLPASNPDARIGSLFYNPGGPGAPAIEFLQLSAFAIPSEIK
jgi:hypothetical protein